MAIEKELSGEKFKMWLQGNIQDSETQRMLWGRVKKTARVKDYQGKVVNSLAPRKERMDT